jgi:ABC-type lipoprotein export system ATPase subunit
MSDPVLEVAAVSKQYGALRPLRIEHLALVPGDQVALFGLDQPAAEVLINLLTGLSLPDAGHVRVFGRSTADITDSGDWLTTLDRFGIVTERATLLESMSVIQNLAMPFSLAIEPPEPEVARQAEAIAIEVGLPVSTWGHRVGDLDPGSRVRLRLGRALAFNPGVLLIEHPSAAVPRHDVIRLARDARRVAEQRSIAALTITADREYAASAATRALVLEPATGRLKRR